MLLQRTIRFGDKRAAEAMTPRVDVVGLQTDRHAWPSCSTLARETGHSRFPVYEDTLDLVTGVAGGARRARASPRRAGRPRRWPRSPASRCYVPESLDLDRCWRPCARPTPTWRSSSTSTAAPTAWSPIEDLVEELVGEIADEYDPDAVDETGTRSS